MKRSAIRVALLLACSLLCINANAADLPWKVLGPSPADWKGATPTNESAWTIQSPGEASFRYPDGTRGIYKHGFRTFVDGTENWQDMYGLKFEVKNDSDAELDVAIQAESNKGPGKITHADIGVSKGDWKTITLSWSSFDMMRADTSLLKFVKNLKIQAKNGGAISIRNVRLIEAPAVSLQCDVRGRSAESGKAVEYPFTVSNCTDRAESVALSLQRYGWETMDAVIEPASLALAPGERKSAVLKVTVSPRVPSGGHEVQEIQAIANGDAALASKLTFVTTAQLPHPYILHTADRWQEVRDKVAKYDWAKEAQDGILQTADKWQAPEIAKPPKNDPDDTMGPFLFPTQVENGLIACGYAYQLTGDKKYAEKIATFMRRLSDPRIGYPKTLRGCNQSLVQEGGFFQHIAMAYDMAMPAGVFSDDDRKQIEATLRIYIETIERESDRGAINNWNLAESCGAFYCALAIQDLATADRFFQGPSGIVDQLTKGTMDDGWWYECSISYNQWCASEFTQAALAYEPFGYNFRTAWFRANYSEKVLLAAELNGGAGATSDDPSMKRKPFGMDPDVYGPTKRPFRKITDLWNSMLPFIDYRGVMFGVNDSTENKMMNARAEVGGSQPFELAYYVYRDPAYAAIIKRGGAKRDLLYGVPELPEKTPEQFRDSAFADNVGITMLRSQTPNRPQREQIQAALHYGTHGWAHGHFDRTDLLSLMRYGRSFWNPESVFWVYEPFMYKFYCQTSLNHNMVVVDQKMQEATPGERILFHTGKLMQATAVQTTARWSNPPYGGMVYDYVPVKTFAEKGWREGRSVPEPPNPPKYGSLTDYTEPILQRRLMVVTDDYVVLADYLKGNQPHTFDSLVHLKGFEGLHGDDKQLLRHDAQWSSDLVSSAQFVTDCDWYSVKAPALAKFEERWGPGEDEVGSRSIGNEPGALRLDVHSVWPPQQQIMVGTAPELADVQKRLYYTVRGDGKVLADGKFGAWILGKGNIDVPLDGVKSLQLETRTELAKMATLFWAGGVIVKRDGSEIPLSQLPTKFENIQQPKANGQDYFGGPIKIAGNSYTEAVPAEPTDAKQPALVTVDLNGVDAVRFKCVIGGDYPVGPEKARRKVYAVRAPQGTEARFLTVIEPYESKSLITHATATSADSVRVELSDGRVQELKISNFEGDGKQIAVSITESKSGEKTRTESTSDEK